MKSERPACSNAIDFEAWKILYHKRLYYAKEITTLINTIPTEQARQVLEIIHTNTQTPDIYQELDKFMSSMDAIPNIHRLALLLDKYNQNACCYACGISGLLASFLLFSLNLQAPNHTLH